MKKLYILVAMSCFSCASAFAQSRFDVNRDNVVDISDVNYVISTICGAKDLSESVHYIVGSNILDGNWSDNPGVSSLPMFFIPGTTDVLIYQNYFTTDGWKIQPYNYDWDMGYMSGGLPNTAVWRNGDMDYGNIFFANDGCYTVMIEANNHRCLIYDYDFANEIFNIYTSMGIIGVNGDWENEIPMTPANKTGENHVWVAKVTNTSDTEFKFRANASWDHNWGVSNDDTDSTMGYCLEGTNNLTLKAGEWMILFSDIHGMYNILPYSYLTNRSRYSSADASHDGNVDISDVNEIISYICGNIHVDSTYYLVGDMCGWDEASMKPFTHTSTDVYDDPEFQLTFTTTSDSTSWQIIPKSNVDAGDIMKKPGVFGVETDGDTSLCGSLTDAADCGKGMIAEAGRYQMTINMLAKTYALTRLPDASAADYYIFGTLNNWSYDNTSALYPTSSTTASYTSYFSGQWDCRIASSEQIAAQNWSSYGAQTDNDGSCTVLVENSDKCMTPGTEGYYTLNVDFNSMTYSWTPITPSASYETIGLVGVANNWDDDIQMTRVQCSSSNDTHNWYALGVTIDDTTIYGVKFRANGSWDVNWGNDDIISSDKYVYGTGLQYGPNITVTPGTYNVYLNDITGQFFFVKQ